MQKKIRRLVPVQMKHLGLYPQGDFGYKETRLMQRSVNQQVIRATVVFVYYLCNRSGAKNETVLYYRPLCCK